MPEHFALVPRRYGDRIDFPVHHAGMLAHLLGMGLQCGHIANNELMVAIVRVAEHETDGFAAPDRDAVGNEPHRFRHLDPHDPCRCAGASSEEHTSELQSLKRISYAVFCLKKKKKHTITIT